MKDILDLKGDVPYNEKLKFDFYGSTKDNFNKILYNRIKFFTNVDVEIVELKVKDYDGTMQDVDG